MNDTMFREQLSLTKQSLKLVKQFGIKLPDGLLETLVSETNREIRERNEEIRVDNERIVNGINFELFVVYDYSDTYPGDRRPKKVDIIPLEGFVNAMKIFTQYRSIGFNLNLQSITLTLDDKKVKKVTFKK